MEPSTVSVFDLLPTSYRQVSNMLQTSRMTTCFPLEVPIPSQIDLECYVIFTA